MQTGLPENLSLSFKKELQNSSSIVQTPENTAVEQENSSFLATLKTVTSDSKRVRDDTALKEEGSSLADAFKSDIEINRSPDDHFKDLTALLNSALCLQKGPSFSGAESTEVIAEAVLVNLLNALGLNSSQLNDNPHISDQLSAKKEELTAYGFDENNQLLKLNTAWGQRKTVTEEKELTTKAKSALYSIIKALAPDSSKNAGSTHPPDSYTGQGLQEKLLSYLQNAEKEIPNGDMVSDEKKAAVNLFKDLIVETPKSNEIPKNLESASEKVTVNPNGGNLEKSNRTKFGTDFQQQEKGAVTGATTPKEGTTAVEALKGLIIDFPKSKGGPQISEHLAQKMAMDAAAVILEKQKLSKYGIDFEQQKTKTNTEEALLYNAASHLKDLAVNSPKANTYPQLSSQTTKEREVTPAVLKDVAIEKTTAKTESGPHQIEDSGPKIKFVDSLNTEDLSDKASKINPELGNKVPASSNSRASDRMPESVLPSKDPETVQGFFRAGALSQIVEKAAFNLKNGQSQVKIDLKPDFLGHVRMQISTENHQVTVKIATEFSVVKDIIENNIHQLKANLENHGLEIDKIDVSVAKDSNQYNSGRQHAELLKMEGRTDSKEEKDGQIAEDLNGIHQLTREKSGQNEIDFFA
jgi:flagellar hook-length control protein FliK